MSAGTKEITVVIPFFNEADNINSLSEALNNFFKYRNYDAEVIFVDDGSTDGSVQKLMQSEHKYYKGVLLTLSKNYGSHDALRAGILNASKSFVITLSADMQDPLELIDMCYEKRRSEGSDIVLAGRTATKYSFSEQFFSRLFAALMKKTVDNKFPLKGFDIVFFNEKVKQQLNTNVEPNSSLHLQILMLGFKQSIVFYEKRVRENGKSKWTVAKKIKLLIDSVIAFSHAPVRFISMMGGSFFILGILGMIYIMGVKVIGGNIDVHFVGLISVLMIGFGVTNISLGIIAEYLWRTLDTTRNRPVFIIDKVVELNTATV
jgi:dolichol-phosphate mannosyltransferase